MGPCQSIRRDLHLPTAESAATKLAPDTRCRYRRKSNDDKPRVADIANTRKFGRMALPAYGGAHADWTHWTRSHRRQRNTSFASSPGQLHVKGHRMTSRQSIPRDLELPTVEAAATAPGPDKGGR
jgi:hypothetical protein